MNNYTASAELDTNFDGVVDADKRKLPNSRTLAPADFDADGIPDYRDLDSDNDGISDSVEVHYSGSSSASSSSDELVQRVLQSKASVTPLAADRMLLQDQDKDGIANYRDIDSDNDGLNDLLENDGPENNTNGRVDPFVDANQDGMDDALSTKAAFLTLYC